MVKIDDKDRLMLGFIAGRGEVFFKELNEEKIMAKATLSKHLLKLREAKLIKKTISKKRKLGSHDTVYVITKKGKTLYDSCMDVEPTKLKDWFG